MGHAAESGVASGGRLLAITPAHDEAENLHRLAASMLAQRRAPDLWVVADDGSTDDTPAILAELVELVPFLRVVSVPQPDAAAHDRLAVALEARAFNWAIGQLELDRYDYVSKVDADLELAPEHFQRLLAAFGQNPRLGIAGASLAEFTRGRWRRMVSPREHVHGAVKLYSRRCFAAIGGMREQLGWDIVDEAAARMRGFETYSLLDLIARHHRPIGTAQGALRGQARIGASAWIAGYPGHWIALRSVKMAARRPWGLSGLAFAGGYLRAALRRVPQVDDRELRAFLRAELSRRLRRPLSAVARVPRVSHR